MLPYAPSLSTRTRSLSMTVGIRCAMVQTVQSLNSLRIIFWIRLSVAVSTDAVASSSTSILDCCSRARPRATSCRCPTLQLSPFSRTACFKVICWDGYLFVNCDYHYFSIYGMGKERYCVFSHFFLATYLVCQAVVLSHG